MTPPVDVVGRTGTVLRALAAHEPGGATTTEVAQWCGLARPTAHRLLSALAREGLADRDPGNGRWLLGPELFFLGTAAAARYDVTAVAHPFVRRLADATGESAFFSARRGDETICLVREDGSFPIRSHVLSEGVRFPLGVASAGMVVLAHLPDAEVEELLARTDLTAAWGEQHRTEEVRRHIALHPRPGVRRQSRPHRRRQLGTGRGGLRHRRAAPVGAEHHRDRAAPGRGAPPRAGPAAAARGPRAVQSTATPWTQRLLFVR